MKKNISINISGIIFHIEEDGYENLRKYLDSINKYFSSFDDSTEIMADIESRIAEIFLSKLNEGKQVITSEDVNALVATMGSVSDFRAVEEQEPQASASSAATGSARENSEHKDFAASKNLLRDKKRKILGGVCAGLGSYLNVDPVWIRLLFAILAFAYGITILVYAIMWIVIPGSDDLPEPEVRKKLFRDPERKVIAGVSGGLASFLGIDIIAVRVLFIVFTIMGGVGFVVYIVLWAVLPEAKTLTDKMQMQGEPVTLHNIESTLKKNQGLTGSDEENTFAKILLFPFRLIGILISALAKVLVPIIEVVRVAIGILITLLGLALVFATVVAGGTLAGIFTKASLMVDGRGAGFPVEVLTGTFSPVMVLAAFIVIVIPGIFVLLLGISTIAKRIVFNNVVGWTLFVCFFASVGVLAVTVPGVLFSFKQEGEYQVENVYHPNGKKLWLKMNETGLDDYDMTHLTLKGYDGKEVKLVQAFGAQGSTRQDAIENAKMIEYHTNFTDSVLTFDSNVTFKKGAKFRAQRLDLTLYIPYDMPYVLDKDLNRFVTNYFSNEDLEENNTWKMTDHGNTCITCPEKKDDGHSDLADFNAVDINGVIDADITEGDHYSVEMIGPEDEKKYYELYKRDETLVIEFSEHNDNFWKNRIHGKDLKIKITMPQLQKLEAKGAGNIRFHDFHTDEMELEVLGAVEVKGELHAQKVNVDISGASTVELQGDAQNLDASVHGASNLNAFSLEVNDAVVEVNGASNASVKVNGTLDMEEGIASDIKVHGSPKIINHD